MTQRKYGWKKGARTVGDPEAIGEAIDEIRSKRGGDLKPEDVVEAARDKGSVLHGAFEWSDTKAAEKYRLEQARSLIRSVIIINQGRETTVRAYVAVPAPEKKAEARLVYTSIEDAMQDPLRRAYVMKSAQAELIAWRKKYSELEEFAALFAQIDAFAA